jgi:hypothetical protein
VDIDGVAFITFRSKNKINKTRSEHRRTCTKIGGQSRGEGKQGRGRVTTNEGLTGLKHNMQYG